MTVIKANDLKNAEMIGKSDPYAAIFIRPIFRYKTKTIDNNLNPVWNQAFELIAEDKETQSLIIEVLIYIPSSFIPFLLVVMSCCASSSHCLDQTCPSDRYVEYSTNLCIAHAYLMTGF